MSRWLVSAAHESSGKTTVSIGLCAALRRRGLTVQTVQEGTRLHRSDVADAGGRARLSQPRSAPDRLGRARRFVPAPRRRRRSPSLVEGNHRPARRHGRSTAATATRRWPGRLELPVVLVLDARGTARGIAPLVLGYQAFEPRLRIAGVVLNRVGGSRHETQLRQALERYTDVPVLGALGEDPRLAIVERHLGLMPSNETARRRAAGRDPGRRDRRGRRLDASVGWHARSGATRGRGRAGDATSAAASGTAGIARGRRPRQPRLHDDVIAPARTPARRDAAHRHRARRGLRFLLRRRPRGAAGRRRRAGALRHAARHAPARARRPVHRRRFSRSLHAQALPGNVALRAGDPRGASTPGCRSTPSAAD